MISNFVITRVSSMKLLNKNSLARVRAGRHFERCLAIADRTGTSHFSLASHLFETETDLLLGP